ncbi:hypothetical protein ACFWJ5_22570 [Streptomyces qaidamensis]|uniref:hypothetical protein n=1 Tax=Streptomyces qaidamensis TaxID=1783515 RepID=UPI003663E33C
MHAKTTESRPVPRGPDGLSAGGRRGVDPRIAQIERLKTKVAELKEHLAQRDETVAELTTFKELAVSRLAAQHDEIVRLRERAAVLGNVRRLPAVRPGTAPYGSCS